MDNVAHRSPPPPQPVHRQEMTTLRRHRMPMVTQVSWVHKAGILTLWFGDTSLVEQRGDVALHRYESGRLKRVTFTLNPNGKSRVEPITKKGVGVVGARVCYLERPEPSEAFGPTQVRVVPEQHGDGFMYVVQIPEVCRPPINRGLHQRKPVPPQDDTAPFQALLDEAVRLQRRGMFRLAVDGQTLDATKLSWEPLVASLRPRLD